MPAPYFKIDPQPDEREPDFLVKVDPRDKVGSPDQRDPYDMVAPGLYPDETAYQLDDGTQVAVSVETYWLDNGEGVALRGYARWIEEDGQSHTTFDDKEVLSEYEVTIPPEVAAKYTVDDMATDVALILLGQDPVLEEHITNGLGKPETHKLIKLNDRIRGNTSIKQQVELVKQTEGAPKLKL